MKWLLGIIVVLAVLLSVPYVLAGQGERKLTDEARAAAPGQFADLTGGRVHYLDLGPRDGEPVVMVHGFSTPHFIFQQNADALVAEGFRVILYDHFGRGWSDRPRTKYDDNFYVRELSDLLEVLELDEPVHLVGLSMGGAIVPEFVAQNPAWVSSVVLFVPAGLTLAGDADSLTVRLMRTPVIGDYLWRISAKGVLLGDPQYQEDAIPEAKRLQGDVTEQMTYKGYFEALLSSYRHFPMEGRTDSLSRFAATDTPTLAIFGDADPTIDIASADQLASLVPHADVRVIEGGTHGLNYQNWETVNPWLIDFFVGQMSVEDTPDSESPSP